MFDVNLLQPGRPLDVPAKQYTPAYCAYAGVYCYRVQGILSRLPFTRAACRACTVVGSL